MFPFYYPDTFSIRPLWIVLFFLAMETSFASNRRLEIPSDSSLVRSSNPSSSQVNAISTRSIRFSGLDWDIKEGINLGPQNNNWSATPDHVWVDELGKLHLRITRNDNRWYSSEIICRDSLGYGRYTWMIESPIDRLDANVVLGLFTYLDANRNGLIEPENGDGEIDIEFSRWGDPSADYNTVYAIHPTYPDKSNRDRFLTQLNGSYSTHSFLWLPGEIRFLSTHGFYLSPPNEKMIIRNTIMNHVTVPIPNGEKVHMNFWIYKPTPASSSLEIVITRFLFEPLSLQPTPTLTPIPTTGILHWKMYE